MDAAPLTSAARCSVCEALQRNLAGFSELLRYAITQRYALPLRISIQYHDSRRVSVCMICMIRRQVWPLFLFTLIAGATASSQSIPTNIQDQNTSVDCSDPMEAGSYA